MLIGFCINKILALISIQQFQREVLQNAGTIPLTSIIVVAVFGPGWVLIFGDKNSDADNKSIR
ncbi:hypothetical protein ACGE24_05780 [Corynebacterium kroppenstedtii]|uniref:hypothetical protein n=1 Tax=Corynebacterium sp. PCR 32 TaxID=3351342 RepID=UPI0030980D65